MFFRSKIVLVRLQVLMISHFVFFVLEVDFVCSLAVPNPNLPLETKSEQHTGDVDFIASETNLSYG